jgi:hypothetical protein
MTNDNWKVRLAKVLMLVFSMVLSLVIVDVGLRYFIPNLTVSGASSLDWMASLPEERYTLDPEFGFRPVLGGRFYGAQGARENDYDLVKTPGRSRLLFIGDSVTQRGEILRALRELYGEEQFEYWNAGVDSFNTVQEVNYYRSFNRPIEPEHVILTFHLNDFETTPVSFMADGDLMVFAPKTRLENISAYWYQHSALYRTFISLKIYSDGGARGRESIVREVRASLLELKTMTAADNCGLTVLVFPYMQPLEEWRDDERGHYADILTILADLEIRHFDLWPTTDLALRAGVQVAESPGDSWHPSADVADLFASFLYEAELLPMSKSKSEPVTH